MYVYSTFGYIMLGCLLGVIGQGTRAIVGAISGGLGAVILLGEEINRQFLLTIIAMGYAGTDFIKGFMKSRLSKYKL
ncbi:MAG: hypothetical protein H0Z40_09970 [Desulfotomaculum sp.]|nr:hypothetical protein [Desulfotomaculum sp.]